jgi:hypothetical protein
MGIFDLLDVGATPRWSTGRSATWSANRTLLASPRAGVPGVSERGDAFGSALTDAQAWWQLDHGGTFAIGAPGEDFGGRGDVGAVTYIDTGRPNQPRSGVQRVAGLAGRDRFGSSFELAERTEQDESSEPVVIVGASGADTGARNAGRYVMPHPGGVTPFVHGVALGERLGGAAPTSTVVTNR